MLATGLLALHQLTGEKTWLTSATDLLDIALAHFADPQRPGRWFDTADDAEPLVLRPADPLDGATPSGASSITEALLTAGHLVGADRYLRAAADALREHSVLLERAPRSAGHWLAVAEAAVRGPLQIAVACDPSRSPLLAEARRLAPGSDRARWRRGLGAAARGSGPGGRRRRRLRVPRAGLRPAGHPRRRPGGVAR